MTGVAEFKEGVSIFNPNVVWSDKITFGKGWAYGCDVSLEKSLGIFIRIYHTDLCGTCENFQTSMVEKLSCEI